MAIIKKDGHLSGRIGDYVFQYQKGVQTVRQRPGHYNDRRTEEQIELRHKFKDVQQLYRKVKQAVKDCFEDKRPNQRDCDAFMSLNIKDFGMMSHGSLPQLYCYVEDGHLCFHLYEEEWKKGDLLRFVQVGETVARYSDTTITDTFSRIVMSEPLSDGEYCWIHIREVKGKQKVSTQKLVTYKTEDPQ